MIATVKATLPNMPLEQGTHSSLPPDHMIERIAFMSDVANGYSVAHGLPFPVQMKAVLIPADAVLETDLISIQLVLIPASEQDDRDRSTAARAWVESGGGQVDRCMPIVLQGAQIFWSQSRTAIIAAAERLHAVRSAVIEFCFFESELRDVERQIGDRWSQLDVDTPLAFEFHEQAISERKELMQRFRVIIGLRSRGVRMAPHIQCPHVFPPTLASQISERMREKSRVAERLEFMREQIEVFEKVYEMCSQRASDFVANRTSHMLEWVIILLLAAKTILLVVNLLSSAGT